ncbi:DUF2510 domain-containing protein [Jonesiaceae bacterium BS-20]|uniref:DUF2510 domain-containing protein n=1 Tax=Jonesiaceae bacterium BS-20 TaxID=3120821 RepID=A0AAU7DW55_9MICO
MSAPQPGWYPDPSNSHFLRFFDGHQWTNLNFSIPTDGQITPEMVAAAQQYMAGLGAQMPNPQTAPVQPDTFQSADRYVGQNAQSSFVGQGSPYMGGEQGQFPGGLDEQKPKTSGFVWAIMAIAVVGIAGIGIWSMGLEGSGGSKPTSEFSADYLSLDMGSGFGCEGLAEEALYVSEINDPEGQILTGLVDTEMIRDSRDRFAIPTDIDAEPAVAFTCKGAATYDDGTTRNIEFDFSVDYYEDLYVYYEEK